MDPILFLTVVKLGNILLNNAAAGFVRRTIITMNFFHEAAMMILKPALLNFVIRQIWHIK